MPDPTPPVGATQPRGLAERLTWARGNGLVATARSVARSRAYRRVRLGVYGARAGDHVAPPTPAVAVAVLAPDDWPRAVRTNPHLTPRDLEVLRTQPSTCLAVLDGDEVVASTWMTVGPVWQADLAQTVAVGPGEHFSWRSHVVPDHRGRGLFAHMVFHHATTVAPDDRLWGLVYDWNRASVRSLEGIGWRRTGEVRATVVRGRGRPARWT